jgi:hypothetical protein
MKSENLFIAMALKPFIALVVFVAVRILANAVRARMAEGRLKRLLFTRLR